MSLLHNLVVVPAHHGAGLHYSLAFGVRVSVWQHWIFTYCHYVKSVYSAFDILSKTLKVRPTLAPRCAFLWGWGLRLLQRVLGWNGACLGCCKQANVMKVVLAQRDIGDRGGAKQL